MQPLSPSYRSHKARPGCKTFFLGTFHNTFNAHYGVTPARSDAQFLRFCAEERATPRIRMNMVTITAALHPRRLARTYFTPLVALHPSGGTLPLSARRSLVDLLIFQAIIPEYVGKIVYHGSGSARLHPQHSRDETRKRPPHAAAMGHVALATTWVSLYPESMCHISLTSWVSRSLELRQQGSIPRSITPLLPT